MSTSYGRPFGTAKRIRLRMIEGGHARPAPRPFSWTVRVLVVLAVLAWSALGTVALAWALHAWGF